VTALSGRPRRTVDGPLKGWAHGIALTDPLVVQQSPVDVTCLGLELVQMLQPTNNAEIGEAVDDSRSAAHGGPRRSLTGKPGVRWAGGAPVVAQVVVAGGRDVGVPDGQ